MFETKTLSCVRSALNNFTQFACASLHLLKLNSLGCFGTTELVYSAYWLLHTIYLLNPKVLAFFSLVCSGFIQKWIHSFLWCCNFKSSSLRLLSLICSPQLWVCMWMPYNWLFHRIFQLTSSFLSQIRTQKPKPELVISDYVNWNFRIMNLHF